MISLQQLLSGKKNLLDTQGKIISSISLEKVIAEVNNRNIKIILSSERIVPQNLLDCIKNCLYDYIAGCSSVEVELRTAKSELNATDIIQNNWSQLLKQIYSQIPSSRMWFANSTWEKDEDYLYIYLDKAGITFLNKKKCPRLIDNFFSKLGLSIKTVLKEKQREEKDFDIYEEDAEIVKLIFEQNESQKSKIEKNDNRNDNMHPEILLGKSITSESTPIREALNMLGEVTVEGQIFDIETREVKNKSTLVAFGLTDFTQSIGVKLFLSGEKSALLDSLKEQLWVKIRGKIQESKYSQELELIPYDINLAKKPERADTCEEKRVELHLHTRYSAMDALCSPKNVLKLCKSWGHKAVAFTDHGVIQAFPEIYEEAKKTGVKPIYGLEAYVFDDEWPVMINPFSKEIDETVFVAVDIETTGLSFEMDDVIEIGAVKLVNGKIVDRFTSFIKPNGTLSAEITNLTGITDKMLSDAPTIQEVLPEFIKFIGDGVFVAHNAQFDSGFIRRECRKLGINFYNKILDTLTLAQIIYSDLKNHRLDTVAKKLNINMGSHHRAVDDANTCAAILMEMLNEIKKYGIMDLANINDVYKYTTGTVRLNTYHATILVKNKKGLRNLYELVSISHLDYFYKHPRIPKSLLKKYKEGLIIGSGCSAGELYQALLHCADTERIEHIINLCDFLEIQPIQNNLFLVNEGLVSDRKALEKINSKILLLGKKYNKPVVLTGDVHFLEPQDEIYRQILLKTQGFDDADKESGLYLRTTDEMLEECAYLGDKEAYEVVITNPQYICNQVEDNLKPIPDELYAPKIEGEKEQIINMTYDRARELYGNKLPEIVEKRLEKELNSIVSNGYSVIYLIAHKLVEKSIKDGYLVGSRGSVGSSLVATMCGITEVNPLPPHYLCPNCKKSIFLNDAEGIVGPDLPDKLCPDCNTPMKKEGFNIPFETFLGFEGDKVPDIDLNFSGEYQARAHKFTEELFGKNHVFRAGTISTIAEKTAFGFVKNYLEEKNKEANSYEIKRLAQGITGIKRTTGQHPGGVMVVPKDMQIYEFSPIQYPADDKDSGVITTHFDYHSISSRLLKLDLLGHDDPTVIRMLEEETGINAREIPLDDPDTMKIFSSLEPLNINPDLLNTSVGTLGVPEFGTKFVRQMLEDTRPSTFAELVRISGLSHGTDVWLNNAQDLIRSRTATLKDVIATRDDIMIYLIEKGVPPKIAFTIMESVRKGKGIKPEHEEILLQNKKVAPWFIESCKKIKYLFPKAHAVAYVIMAFRIAYCKVHYPEAFYATYFTVRADDFDAELILQGPKKIKAVMAEIDKKEKAATVKEKNLYTILEVANEMYLRGIRFLPIDLYKSDVKRFKITKDGILPPLTSLAGLGIAAAKSVEAERKKREFTSIEDLRQRTRITKNVIEILKQNGILKNLQETNQISLF